MDWYVVTQLVESNNFTWLWVRTTKECHSYFLSPTWNEHHLKIPSKIISIIKHSTNKLWAIGMKDIRKKNQIFPHSLSKSKLMIGLMPLLFKSIPIPLSNFKKNIYLYIKIIFHYILIIINYMSQLWKKLWACLVDYFKTCLHPFKTKYDGTRVCVFVRIDFW